MEIENIEDSRPGYYYNSGRCRNNMVSSSIQNNINNHCGPRDSGSGTELGPPIKDGRRKPYLTCGNLQCLPIYFGKDIM